MITLYVCMSEGKSKWIFLYYLEQAVPTRDFNLKSVGISRSKVQ